jgi:hypothetical protein
LGLRTISIHFHLPSSGQPQRFSPHFSPPRFPRKSRTDVARLWRCPPPPPAPRRRAAAPGAASPRSPPGAPPGLGLRRLRPGPGDPGGAWGNLGEPGGWGWDMVNFWIVYG